MKILCKIILTLTFIIVSLSAMAQDGTGAADLVRQGVQLNDQG
jgi:hypothetical protein